MTLIAQSNALVLEKPSSSSDCRSSGVIDLGHIYKSGARSITIQKKIFPAPCEEYQQQPSTKMEDNIHQILLSRNTQNALAAHPSSGQG